MTSDEKSVKISSMVGQYSRLEKFSQLEKDETFKSLECISKMVSNLHDAHPKSMERRLDDIQLEIIRIKSFLGEP